MNQGTLKGIQPSSTLQRRLTTYSAVAAAAACATGVASQAKAAVVYSGPLSLAVPQNANGIYLDLATGQTNTGSFAGYDINAYGTNSLTFYKPSTTTLESTSTTAAASALAFGTTIGPSAIFSTSTSATNFQVTGTEYLGIRFNNTTTGAINYGWIQFQTTATTGYPATITGYAFENTGGSLLAGQTAVPEPGTNVALGLGGLALGAVALRRMRAAKSVVA